MHGILNIKFTDKVLLHMSDISHVKPLSQNYMVLLKRSLLILPCNSVDEIQVLWLLQNVLVSVCSYHLPINKSFTVH
jgi:hypothetical protein